MSRLIVGLTFATVFAVAAQAQESRTSTVVKGDDGAKTVTYTGCVQTGTETRSFVLDHIVPISRTTTQTAGTSGVTTTTTYALVPGEKVELQSMVGHKVEVTGMLIPGGSSETKTRTKIERENAPDTEIKQKTKTEGAMPQFRVMSVKNLAESCS